MAVRASLHTGKTTLRHLWLAGLGLLSLLRRDAAGSRALVSIVATIEDGMGPPRARDRWKRHPRTQPCRGFQRKGHKA